MGADTIVWLGVKDSIRPEWNGKFFQDRSPTAEHIWLARSHYSQKDAAKYVEMLETLRMGPADADE